MHNGIINENTFLWYQKDVEIPQAISCTIQPSNIIATPTIINLITNTASVTVMTIEVDKEFQLLDKVHLLDLDWYISEIGQVHPIEVRALEHKVLTLIPIPLRRFSNSYISDLFKTEDNQEEIIDNIIRYIKNIDESIACIQQFAFATKDVQDMIVFSLDNISYKRQNDESFIGIAEITMTSVGETAQHALKEFYLAMRNPNNYLSALLETRLKEIGVGNPGQIVAISSPKMENFNMLNNVSPEMLLTLEINLPFVAQRNKKLPHISAIDFILKTQVQYSEKIRSYNARLSQQNS